MRYKIKFSLKDEFDRFCDDYDGQLDIALKNDKRQTVAVKDLTNQQIADISNGGYGAVISTDHKNDPENIIC